MNTIPLHLLLLPWKSLFNSLIIPSEHGPTRLDCLAIGGAGTGSSDILLELIHRWL